MAGWKVAARALHQLGGEALACDVRRVVGGRMTFDPQAACIALSSAFRLGLVNKRRDSRGHRNVWSLTELGRGWAEGRLKQVRPAKDAPRPRQRVWAPVEPAQEAVAA
jgi:hypothetical protein